MNHLYTHTYHSNAFEVKFKRLDLLMPSPNYIPTLKTGLISELKNERYSTDTSSINHISLPY